jgi:hypothetical protein
MRRILLISALAVASALTLTASTSPASAARYCLQGANWGYPGNCQFRTISQCRASASGTNAGCGINPRYASRSGARTNQGTVGMGSGAQPGGTVGTPSGGWYGPRGGLVGGSDSGVDRPTR